VNDRDVARTIGVARAGFGVVFLAAPALATRGWLGPPSSLGPVKMFTRAIGARDLALALLRALESGEPVPPWLRAGAAVDALDTVATVAAFNQLPKALRVVVLALGVGGAVTGLRLADALH
jgi:hypothetical protein